MPNLTLVMMTSVNYKMFFSILHFLYLWLNVW